MKYDRKDDDSLVLAQKNKRVKILLKIGCGDGVLKGSKS